MADNNIEYQVEWSDEVAEKASKDPKLAEKLREFGALARQAMHGVDTGKYDNWAAAMEALTGSRPEPCNLDGDEFELSR